MVMSPVDARHQKIIAALENPLTIEALHEVVPVNMHTLRKDMQQLQNMGIVVPTGMIVNRKPTYVVANKRPIPELYRTRSNEYLSPLVAQDRYSMAPDRVTPSMLAARYLNDAISELLMASVDAANGADSNAVAATLDAVRAGLKDSLGILSEVTDMIQQLLTNPAWWSVEALKSISNDAEWNAGLIAERHSRILQGRTKA